mgnify:CR=1 FL=1
MAWNREARVLATGVARPARCALSICAAVWLIVVAGCSPSPKQTAEDLARFEQAGPVRPEVDVGRLVEAKMDRGAYRLHAGDVIEVQLPAMTQVVATQRPGQVVRFEARVTRRGTIRLPIVGDIRVLGRALPELESAIADAYYPKYVVTRPTVVVQVAEYDKARVSVVGAVRHPGVYELRHNEMSVVTASNF